MNQNVVARLAHCRRWALVAGFAALLSGAAVAQIAPAPSPAIVESPAQPLGDALLSIARQTGISILFDPASVAGRTSQPVSGRLTPAEAVQRALQGSGLATQVMQDGSIVVRPAAAGASSSPQRDGATELERVSVTGSRLSRVVAEGPAPVNVYTGEDIARSGQPTLERFLSGLSEVSMTQGEGARAVTLGQGTVQLRGLPLGSTLVLINGRRVEAVGSSSANFFNLNLIPMGAIERVEIVPVGSSAVYGGDALAGVVNVILKRSLEGPSVTVNAGGGKNIHKSGLSVATGGGGDDGSFLLMGSYSRSTPLSMSDRAFFRDADYRRFGGMDTRTRRCTPGTVSSATGRNLPGLSSSFAAIPVSASGQALSAADFAATAGQANLCNTAVTGQGTALVHGNETLGLHAAGDHRVWGGWSIFGELTYAKERIWADQTGLLLNNVLVPATNPYNPFGEAVRVTTVLGPENGTQGLSYKTDFTRALGGLRGDIGAGWEAELTVSTTRDTGERRTINGTVNVAARTAALASSSTATALNPFATGRAASDEVLGGIWSDIPGNSRGSKDLVNAFARGRMLALPAGDVEAVIGAEYARDRYAVAIPNDLDVDLSRHASAVFTEMRVPIWRAQPSSGPAWPLAALTVAARGDRYSDFGSAATYQSGLEIRPARDLLLRGSFATSFKPPTLLQMYADGTSYPAELFALTDPARGGEAIESGEVVLGSNPELKPERGRAWTVGGVWEPSSSPGTRLGAAVWRVKIRGLISTLLPQTALDYEGQFPGFVERGPSVDGVPGPVTRVLYAPVNFGGIQTGGVDVEAAHAWRGDWGRWSLGASATRTTQYDVVVAPGSPQEDRLGRRFADYWAPRWKGRMTAGLERSAWSVAVTSRYLGSYKDAGTSERRLGNTWMHDLAASLDLKQFGLGFGNAVKRATLMASVTNLTDRQPQFVETTPYYDVTQADWRGRYASVRLAVDW